MGVDMVAFVDCFNGNKDIEASEWRYLITIFIDKNKLGFPYFAGSVKEELKDLVQAERNFAWASDDKVTAIAAFSLINKNIHLDFSIDTDMRTVDFEILYSNRINSKKEKHKFSFSPETDFDKIYATIVKKLE
jgi:hypothetical protein